MVLEDRAINSLYLSSFGSACMKKDGSGLMFPFCGSADALKRQCRHSCRQPVEPSPGGGARRGCVPHCDGPPGNAAAADDDPVVHKHGGYSQGSRQGGARCILQRQLDQCKSFCCRALNAPCSKTSGLTEFNYFCSCVGFCNADPDAVAEGLNADGARTFR